MAAAAVNVPSRTHGTTLAIRLPLGLVEKIALAAKMDDRSMASWARRALEAAADKAIAAKGTP